MVELLVGKKLFCRKFSEKNLLVPKTKRLINQTTNNHTANLSYGPTVEFLELLLAGLIAKTKTGSHNLYGVE